GSERTHRRYGDFLAFMCQRDESIRQLRISAKLDPLSADAADVLTRTLFFARRYDEALAEGRRNVERHPGNAIPYLMIGFAYLGKREMAPAVSAFQKLNSLAAERNPGMMGALDYARAASGDAAG